MLFSFYIFRFFFFFAFGTSYKVVRGKKIFKKVNHMKLHCSLAESELFCTSNRSYIKGFLRVSWLCELFDYNWIKRIQARSGRPNASVASNNQYINFCLPKEEQLHPFLNKDSKQLKFCQKKAVRQKLWLTEWWFLNRFSWEEKEAKHDLRGDLKSSLWERVSIWEKRQ